MNIEQVWDAIIIGAGPAGAFAAYLLAKQGRSVLLLDKAQFPRHKVCGCCLNALSLQLLKNYGLGEVIQGLNPVSLNRFSLRTPQKALDLSIRESVSLSRFSLDYALICSAEKLGATFCSEITALVDVIANDYRQVIARGKSGEVTLKGRVVIVADGLAGRSLEKTPGFEVKTQHRSRIGAGAQLQTAPDCYVDGTIYMTSGHGSYVGMVRLEDGSLDIACAFDLNYVRQGGSPAAAAKAILDEAQMICPQGIGSANWQGTSALCRSRKQKGAERLFVIGDAASYAEPLTGEGISWALMSAVDVQPFAIAAMESWRDRLALDWSTKHSDYIVRRQASSAVFAGLLRSPALTSMAIMALDMVPPLSNKLHQYLNAPHVEIDQKLVLAIPLETT